MWVTILGFLHILRVGMRLRHRRQAPKNCLNSIVRSSLLMRPSNGIWNPQGNGPPTQERARANDTLFWRLRLRFQETKTEALMIRSARSSLDLLPTNIFSDQNMKAVYIYVNKFRARENHWSWSCRRLSVSVSASMELWATPIQAGNLFYFVNPRCWAWTTSRAWKIPTKGLLKKTTQQRLRQQPWPADARRFAGPYLEEDCTFELARSEAL